jgi:hypothetical protein
MSSKTRRRVRIKAKRVAGTDEDRPAKRARREEPQAPIEVFHDTDGDAVADWSAVSDAEFPPEEDDDRVKAVIEEQAANDNASESESDAGVCGNPSVYLTGAEMRVKRDQLGADIKGYLALAHIEAGYELREFLNKLIRTYEQNPDGLACGGGSGNEADLPTTVKPAKKNADLQVLVETTVNRTISEMLRSFDPKVLRRKPVKERLHK